MLEILTEIKRRIKMQALRTSSSICFKLTRFSACDKIIPIIHNVSVRHIKSQRKPYEPQLMRELFLRRQLQGPEPERHRSVWKNWNYDCELYSFGQRLGEEFQDNTLRRMFTHRSYVEAESAKRASLLGEESDVSMDLEDNVELVQKGEELITAFVKAFLRNLFPALPEECVRSVSQYLTTEEMLSYIATHIGVKDLVLTEEFPVATDTLSQSFKAVVGGLYHDQGSDRTQKFIQDFVMTQLIGKDINEFLDILDPVRLLAGILAREGRQPAEPRLINQSGCETVVSVFMVGMYVDKKLIGKSYGESASIAEEMAARDALRTIFGTTLHRTPVLYKQPIRLQDKDFEENISVDEYLKYATL